MRRAHRIAIGWAIVLVGGVILSLPSVHWPIIGWVRGEAFYDGRPTSWWAIQIEKSDSQNDDAASWFQSLRTTVLSRKAQEIRADPLAALCEDEAANAVLMELLRHPNPSVRIGAVAALDPVSFLLPYDKYSYEPPPAAVYEALQEAEQDPEASVRFAVSLALSRLRERHK